MNQIIIINVSPRYEKFLQPWQPWVRKTIVFWKDPSVYKKHLKIISIIWALTLKFYCSSFNAFVKLEIAWCMLTSRNSK